MATEVNWTLETYRLDEIHTKFQLPCVVRTTEGFFSETELEGFSQGDIISINSRKILHKVAAHFTTETSQFTDSPLDEDGYTVFTNSSEILVPLKYKGKLKVISPMKNYSSVKELTLDFPRYAKLRCNLDVESREHRKVTIAAGTVIELDRIFPVNLEDKLVISFEPLGKRVAVALPMNIKAYFRTEPDENEYTVQEVVDRYNLPQIIKFVDDEIKRVYTQDLVDGIENMSTVTDVLQLNRLVSKEVLIGHYKPIEEVERTNGDRFKKRTLIVLPLDNSEIRNIEVNVLIGDPNDTYSDISLVRNVSNTDEIVDGSLYVNLTTSNGIMRINYKDDSHYYNEKTETTTKTDDVTEEDEPPPVPPRLGKPHNKPPEVKQKPKTPHETRAPRLKVEEPPQETYEIMLSPSSSAVGPPPYKYNSKQHEDEVPEAGGNYEIMSPEDLSDQDKPNMTEAPDIFHNNLPEVTADDIEQLHDAVPELSHILSDPAKDEFVIAPKCVPPDYNDIMEDSGELGLKVPHSHRRLPGCKSDSEAIYVNQSLYAVEDGNMSLGDQFDECKVEVDPLVTLSWNDIKALEKSVSELIKEIDEKDKKHKLELDEGKEKFESKIKELGLKHEELEVELDKLKAEFDDKVSDLNSKFQEDMAKLSSEFKKEKEGIVKDLELLKNKPTAVIEVQAVNSIFDKCDMESQCDPQLTQIDTQAQTDLSNQQTSSMQTDCHDQRHLGIQTESVSTKSSTNQTETTDITDSSVQPESILVVEISVQTDTSDNCCDKKHCEESVSETVDTVTDNSETNKVVHGHETDVEKIKKALLAEYEKKIILLETKHEDEISKLIAQIEKEKEDYLQLKSSLTSITGNQQTKLNEAVNRVSREKDSKIEELKIQEMKLNEEIKCLKEQVEVLRKGKSQVEDGKERALSFLKDKEAVIHQMEVELEEARSRCKLDQDKKQGIEATDVNVEQTTPSASNIVFAEEPSLQQKIKEPETMELSISSSTRSLVQDKVSITSCNVGDLVLLCLDERLDQYVVFTVGTTIHYLHTECLTPLGLQSESGEARKQWLVAEVVDKEYCEATKSNNRFKVPIGTKFFRVKAKKWTREVNPSASKKADTASESL